MKTASVHIVRHYGAVGGMENYVYCLTKALARQGQPVTVLCERAEMIEADAGIEVIEVVEVIELGQLLRQPRWLAQWIFSRRVATHIKARPYQGAIIHSHERSSVHHVTTFHGPPFVMRKRRMLDFLSPRIGMWTYLEKRELTAHQVQAILPNSSLIADYLGQLYPAVKAKIAAPALPGVDPGLSHIKRQSGGLTIGFMGREWERKGLDIACQILESVREILPQATFLVAGCEPEKIAPLFKHWPPGSYQLLGWLDTTAPFMQQIDLLLHPARAEPFGMVVAEANAAGIPVLVSDLCGVATLIGTQQGEVCPMNLDHPDIPIWAEACVRLLQSEQPISPLDLSWDTLATQHHNLYKRLLSA